jgi:serine/threonine-protein kinase
VLLVALLAGGGAAAYLLTRPVKKVVPTVVNEQVGVAQVQIQNAGFTPNLIYRPAAQASGIVISQDPLGGAKQKDGATVTLTVSQGPGNVNVPPVTDLSKQAAIATLKQAHLTVSRTLQESSDTIAAGHATRTDPVAGTSLPYGQPITLYVSSGQPLVTVPDVTNQSSGSAKATLENRGFAVQTTTQQSSAVQPDNVISQSPAAGTKVASGSTVAITVATKPPPPATVAVPSVVGDTAAAAKIALQGAGLGVSQLTKNTTKPNQDGNVISQSPQNGKTVKKGSTVTIVVGHFKAPPPPPTTTHTTPTTTTHTTPTTTTRTTK